MHFFCCVQAASSPATGLTTTAWIVLKCSFGVNDTYCNETDASIARRVFRFKAKCAMHGKRGCRGKKEDFNLFYPSEQRCSSGPDKKCIHKGLMTPRTRRWAQKFIAIFKLIFVQWIGENLLFFSNHHSRLFSAGMQKEEQKIHRWIFMSLRFDFLILITKSWLGSNVKCGTVGFVCIANLQRNLLSGRGSEPFVRSLWLWWDYWKQYWKHWHLRGELGCYVTFWVTWVESSITRYTQDTDHLVKHEWNIQNSNSSQLLGLITSTFHQNVTLHPHPPRPHWRSQEIICSLRFITHPMRVISEILRNDS